MQFLNQAGGATGAAMRVNGASTFKVPFVDAEKAPAHVTVEWVKPGVYKASGAGWSHTVTPCSAPKGQAAYVDESRVSFDAVFSPTSVAVLLSTGTFAFKLQALPEGFGDIRFTGGGNFVLSPMPGKVSKFLVPNGSVVKQGQNVLIVEAMKMEHLVKAPCDGTITFEIKEGTMAAADQKLAGLEVPEAEE
jgi:3-methylcrotonyl-CoA carboxylase alpha subunit